MNGSKLNIVGGKVILFKYSMQTFKILGQNQIRILSGTLWKHPIVSANA